MYISMISPLSYSLHQNSFLASVYAFGKEKQIEQLVEVVSLFVNLAQLSVPSPSSFTSLSEMEPQQVDSGLWTISQALGREQGELHSILSLPFISCMTLILFLGTSDYSSV